MDCENNRLRLKLHSQKLLYSKNRSLCRIFWFVLILSCQISLIYIFFKLEQFWQSPEQLRGKKSKGSKEGDIFSLGIILLEIITRSYPYHIERKSMKPKEIVSKIIDRKCQPKFRPQINQELQNSHEALITIIKKFVYLCRNLS